jgi:hypothetical protein
MTISTQNSAQVFDVIRLIINNNTADLHVG